MRKFGGTWSESKLDCVEKYARSYLKVMQNQCWCRLDYVDAFAGRGKQALKAGSANHNHGWFFDDETERADTEEFLVGSAIRALIAATSASRPFDRFIYIDVNEGACDDLKNLVHSDFPSMEHAVEIICNDANAALDNYVDSVDWTATRALVFLDPYGLEVDWSLIRRLAATGACDVWYLFPLGGVIRMMTNDGQIPDVWAARLDQLFGTHEWKEEFYKPSLQQSFFDQEDEAHLKNASTKHVVDYILKRLSTAFPAVSNVAVLRNRKGAPLFALVLGVSSSSPAAQNVALRIANHLVKELIQQ